MSKENMFSLNYTYFMACGRIRQTDTDPSFLACGRILSRCMVGSENAVSSRGDKGGEAVHVYILQH